MHHSASPGKTPEAKLIKFAEVIARDGSPDEDQRYTVKRICEATCMQYTVRSKWVFSESELTFTFAICCRPSACVSVVYLSVTLVHPTQPVEIFGNISTPFGTLAICWHLPKILRRSSQGNPSVGGLNARGGQTQRFWTHRRLIDGVRFNVPLNTL